MDKLESKLIEALASARAAEKVADRALSYAQETFVRLQALENRLGSFAYQPPMENVQDVPSDMDESMISGPVSLSPFSVRYNAPQKLADDLEGEKDES